MMTLIQFIGARVSCIHDEKIRENDTVTTAIG